MVYCTFNTVSFENANVLNFDEIYFFLFDCLTFKDIQLAWPKITKTYKVRFF